MHCDQCEMLSINGVPCHETGCPNSRSRWDGERWIKQRECFECGCAIDADEPCCSEVHSLMSDGKQAIIDALRAFAAQRPGLEFGNYCSGWDDQSGRRAYLSEMRAITKDLHDARTLLRAVELSGVTEAQLVEGFHAFSGRLVPTRSPDGLKLDYCTGQYFPTEFRKAVCAVCAAALWAYHREDWDPAAQCGEKLRARFVNMFGRSIARRWFN